MTTTTGSTTVLIVAARGFTKDQMPKIVETTKCIHCHGKGAHATSFGELSPEGRRKRADQLHYAGDEAEDVIQDCPFCEGTGNQPVYECEECEGGGGGQLDETDLCENCGGTGYYIDA